MAKKPVGRPRGRNGESGDRGAAILDVPERLVASHDYDGVTMRPRTGQQVISLEQLKYHYSNNEQQCTTV